MYNMNKNSLMVDAMVLIIATRNAVYNLNLHQNNTRPYNLYVGGRLFIILSQGFINTELNRLDYHCCLSCQRQSKQHVIRNRKNKMKALLMFTRLL